MASEVKREMIARTAALLAKNGLQRTSFSEILAATGAPRGSLYHHFPGGKDELVLAAVGLAGDYALGALAKMAGRPAIEVAEGFISLWRAILQNSDFHAGCAVAAVTVAADSEVLTKQAGAIFRGWRTRLAELLQQGGLPGERAEPVAAMLIAGCEGAVLLARAGASFEPFDIVAVELVECVRHATSEPSF
jgi:AcrR family transcriptional regulator